MTTASFTPPEPLRPLLARIAAAGRDERRTAYAVGGTVRDALLGRNVRDIDVAVDGDALSWARRLAEDLGGHFVLLDDERAIARIVLDSTDVRTVDVAAMQSTLEQNLRRRDFTIDALAAPLEGGAVIDPCGGLADLAARRVRMTATAVFDADPLRLLRAPRIASELGFTIDEATATAVRERAPTVCVVAPERRRDELARIFALPAVEPALRTLDDLNLLDALLPEVTAGRAVTQPKEHAYDVFEHNLRTVEAMDALLSEDRPSAAAAWMWEELWSAFAWCGTQFRVYFAAELSEGRSRAVTLKLTALLHDAAKPQTRSADADGRIRFFGHADAGAAIAARVMRRLRFSARETRFVSLLVAEHLRPLQLAQVGEPPTRRAIFRFYRDLGDAVPAALFLALADAASARGPALTSEGWASLVHYMNSLVVHALEDKAIIRPPRLLTGRDIMAALGAPEGPLIGRLLRALEEAHAAGEVVDREAALAYVAARAREDT